MKDWQDVHPTKEDVNYLRKELEKKSIGSVLDSLRFLQKNAIKITKILKLK